MASAYYRASAPGSLMLLGEHAVLHGHAAVVAAVNRRIRAAVRVRTDQKVYISSALGKTEASLEDLTPQEPHSFVLATIAYYREQLASGLDVRIESDFEHSLGLGSSAAVTAAVTGCLSAITESQATAEALLEPVVSIIRRVQGSASGADAAAALLGGTLIYHPDTPSARRLAHDPPLAVVYSGYKKPTPQVIAMVAHKSEVLPDMFAEAMALIGRSAEEGAQALDRGDWSRLGAICDFAHGLMEAIGVVDRPLAEIVHFLRNSPHILGAKVSGAGLGDCVIGIGTVSIPPPTGRLLEIAVTREGLQID